MKSKGPRARTRDKLRARRRVAITDFVRKFETGQKAALTIDPSSHKGMPFHRFKGLTGTIVGRQGRAYILEVREMGREKKIVTFPEHLKPIKG